MRDKRWLLIYTQNFWVFYSIIACYEKIVDTCVNEKKNNFLERESGMAPAVWFNLDTPITQRTYYITIALDSKRIYMNLIPPLPIYDTCKPQLKFKKNSWKPVSRPSKMFRCGVVTQERQSRMILFNCHNSWCSSRNFLSSAMSYVFHCPSQWSIILHKTWIFFNTLLEVDSWPKRNYNLQCMYVPDFTLLLI